MKQICVPLFPEVELSQPSRLELAISASSCHFCEQYASAIMMVLTVVEGP